MPLLIKGLLCGKIKKSYHYITHHQPKKHYLQNNKILHISVFGRQPYKKGRLNLARELRIKQGTALIFLVWLLVLNTIVLLSFIAL